MKELIPQQKCSWKELVFASQADFPPWLSGFALMWHLTLQIQLPGSLPFMLQLCALARSANTLFSVALLLLTIEDMPFFSIYHPSHPFSAEFLVLLPRFLLGWFFFLLLRNEGCTHIFSLLALSSSREGSGKLPPFPSGTHCPHSQWLTHGHLAFHIVSTISSPKWEGRSSAYPHSVLCPFQGLWMTTDGILKRSGWIMHFRFSSQSETLWVGNEKENFR